MADDNPLLAAGTVVSFSTDFATPLATATLTDVTTATWKAIKGCLSVGAIGLIGESKEKTTLADVEKRYQSGMSDATDKNVQGQHFPDNVDQKEFLDLCAAKTPMMIRYELKNKPDPTGTGSMAVFEYAPNGWEWPESTAPDWQLFSAPGKQNGLARFPPTAGV